MNNSISIQSQSIVSSWSPSGHGQMLPEAGLKFHLSGGLLDFNPGTSIHFPALLTQKKLWEEFAFGIC